MPNGRVTQGTILQYRGKREVAIITGHDSKHSVYWYFVESAALVVGSSNSSKDFEQSVKRGLFSRFHTFRLVRTSRDR